MKHFMLYVIYLYNTYYCMLDVIYYTLYYILYMIDYVSHIIYHITYIII